MIRWTAAILSACLLGATSGLAGDFADRSVIGFSADGAYFAFEEYGVEDGSGFPYANVFLLETANDRWVSGSPIRVKLQDETATLAHARATALADALPLINSLAIDTDGRVLASNPVTETSADPHALRFALHGPVASVDTNYDLRIVERVLPAADCPDMGVPFKGFRLELGTPQGTRILNDDARIPSSRRCPIGYGLSDVIAHIPARPARPIAIVLINVFSIGFEGPDRRFIAVAAGL
ncbi:MAG: DUF2259 domain-containing protein [Alphaproteobacteria bacterium]